ncbi:hypothetical protein, partial [Staphylococcus felis]|uniref:hypothetical protein n=1 Tax=Staphylococcus felis TaxID=46127 RepID=UPI001EE92041
MSQLVFYVTRTVSKVLESTGSRSNWTGRIKLRRYALMDCLTPFSLCDHKVLNINACLLFTFDFCDDT